MKKLITIVGSLFLLVMIGSVIVSDEPDFLTRYNLHEMNQKERVAYLENQLDEPFNVGVRHGYIEYTDGKESYKEKLDNDLFYLSFAPYLTTTHPCDYHSISGCRAELKNKELDVLIKDSSGAILLDERVETFENGFYGVWLPRDIQGTIEVRMDGKSAIASFETYLDSKTCLTDLKLM